GRARRPHRPRRRHAALDRVPDLRRPDRLARDRRGERDREPAASAPRDLAQPAEAGRLMPAEAAQHVAGLKSTVDGTELDPELRNNVLEVRVRDSLSVPASALIRIHDPKAAKVDNHPLQLGKTVEIKMGGLAQTTTEAVFKGEVVSLE